jgi:hypothetical protein
MVTQLEWSAALAVLKSLIPSCDSFVPDSIADAARDVGCTVTFEPISDWESRTDQDIFDELVHSPIGECEKLVIVTEASYSKERGPFTMIGSELGDFVLQHLSTCGECAVNGDVIILRPERHTIILFHHEGYCATIAIRQDRLGQDSGVPLRRS